MNFYLSFLRYPLHRLAGAGDPRFISGFPFIGSLFVAAALYTGWSSPVLIAISLLLLLIDTGGPLWFAASMLRQRSEEG